MNEAPHPDTCLMCLDSESDELCRHSNPVALLAVYAAIAENRSHVEINQLLDFYYESQKNLVKPKVTMMGFHTQGAFDRYFKGTAEHEWQAKGLYDFKGEFLGKR
jgi:hypothetical protein